jgi:SAM-dependent methyltransferase
MRFLGRGKAPDGAHAASKPDSPWRANDSHVPPKVPSGYGNQEEYYDRRAPEYDDLWSARGIQDDRQRADALDQVRRLREAIRHLRPALTVDVGCGTGYLTQNLRGEVVALDQSPSMLHVARRRLKGRSLIEGDATALPFRSGVFERVFASHVYGHLVPEERAAFVGEARRVASELVVVDTAVGNEVSQGDWEERRLLDGSRYLVYKRFFTPEGLLSKLGGQGKTFLRTSYFVGVRTRYM